MSRALIGGLGKPGLRQNGANFKRLRR